MCCLFVGLVQMLWVLPVHHFFKNALMLPPFVLHACWACPNALGAARASLFSKMHWYYNASWCLFVGLAQFVWGLTVHHFSKMQWFYNT